MPETTRNFTDSRSGLRMKIFFKLSLRGFIIKGSVVVKGSGSQGLFSVPL